MPKTKQSNKRAAPGAKKDNTAAQLATGENENRPPN